jgi:hypothetical protein
MQPNFQQRAHGEHDAHSGRCRLKRHRNFYISPGMFRAPRYRWRWRNAEHAPHPCGTYHFQQARGAPKWAATCTARPNTPPSSCCSQTKFIHSMEISKHTCMQHGARPSPTHMYIGVLHTACCGLRLWVHDAPCECVVCACRCTCLCSARPSRRTVVQARYLHMGRRGAAEQARSAVVQCAEQRAERGPAEARNIPLLIFTNPAEVSLHSQPHYATATWFRGYLIIDLGGTRPRFL